MYWQVIKASILYHDVCVFYICYTSSYIHEINILIIDGYQDFKLFESFELD